LRLPSLSSLGGLGLEVLVAVLGRMGECMDGRGALCVWRGWIWA